MTRNEFELLSAVAALAGLRNPREDQYLAQVQARAEAVADAYQARGYFDPPAEGCVEPATQRFDQPPAQAQRGLRPPPIVVPVGMGKPGEGVKRAVVVDQTQKVNGRPPPMVVHQGAQQGSNMPQRQTSNTTPKPHLNEPRVNAPRQAIVGGPPQPKITPPPAASE